MSSGRHVPRGGGSGGSGGPVLSPAPQLSPTAASSRGAAASSPRASPANNAKNRVTLPRVDLARFIVQEKFVTSKHSVWTASPVIASLSPGAPRSLCLCVSVCVVRVAVCSGLRHGKHHCGYSYWCSQCNNVAPTHTHTLLAAHTPIHSTLCCFVYVHQPNACLARRWLLVSDG